MILLNLETATSTNVDVPLVTEVCIKKHVDVVDTGPPFTSQNNSTKPTIEQILNASKEDLQRFENVNVDQHKENTECCRCTCCRSCYSCSNCNYSRSCGYCDDCTYCDLCDFCCACNYCDDCSYCYGITNGENLQFVVYGQQLTKEQYQEFIKKHLTEERYAEFTRVTKDLCIRTCQLPFPKGKGLCGDIQRKS